MVVYTYRINYKYGDTIKIKPLFDVHYGNTDCDVQGAKKYLKEEDDDNTYIIGGGDLMDSIVVPDIRYRKSQDAMKEDMAIIDRQIDGIEEMLSPYKERLIGLVSGNHEANIIRRAGTDPIARLSKALNCKNLGYSGLVKLMLRENGARGRTVTIRYHHGWGGGSRTQGADLTKFSKDLQYWQADIFLYGHVHRKQADRVPRLGLSGEELISKPKILCICGTFLKTYSKGINSTYSEEKGYPPVEVGGLVVNIKPLKRWVDIWVDV